MAKSYAKELYMIRNLIRALRVSFLSASILPFVFGSLIDRRRFNPLTFILGISCAVCTHLSANLINDYADSKSGADWQDRNFYGFFGGSKLIQDNIFPEKFYFNLSLFFAVIAGLAALVLYVLIGDFRIIFFYLIIIFLGWSYSHGPLRLSYRRVGEIFIFLLFGPALVMGAYFIQTGLFPDVKSLLLSLPFGFLTTAILFANEIPDYDADMQANKFTWVSLTGRKNSYILYFFIVLGGFLAVVFNFVTKNLGAASLPALLLIVPALKAAHIIKNNYLDKQRLIESSRITISLEIYAGIILIISQLI